MLMQLKEKKKPIQERKVDMIAHATASRSVFHAVLYRCTRGLIHMV